MSTTQEKLFAATYMEEAKKIFDSVKQEKMEEKI